MQMFKPIKKLYSLNFLSHRFKNWNISLYDIGMLDFNKGSN